ncbi:MAG TPA: PRK09639 family protein [Desulfotomaculum sp.]|nr:MAG: RNA polymerase sigma factor SigX [Desulfotomaculum sp. BICA1-6]HBX23052.1 PRK09639 family protein [Desulfotomaculum sp.]
MNGMPAIYQELYNRYHPFVCRQLTYMLADRAMAEDVAQEVFLKLYSSPPREFQNIGGWLSRVATNLAYNYLRSEKSRQRREEKTSLPGRVADSSEEQALKNEEVRSVRLVLDDLPERDQLCLLMKHSGFTYEDIAAATGLKKSSVGTIIARAQARFKKVYLEQKGSGA